MESNSGLTVESVQKAICNGETYGRKEWSPVERQAACLRYEELTGTKLESSYRPVDLSVIAMIFAVILATVLGYLVYRHKTRRKTTNKVSTNKNRRR